LLGVIDEGWLMDANLGDGAMRFRMLLGAALVAAAALVACGGGEPAQRKAFIEFLQTRIIAKPGIHVPTLTSDEAAAFGDYAKQYAVITDFNAALDNTVSKPLQAAISAGAPHSVQEVVARRNDVAAVRDGMAKIRAALTQQLAIADAAHAALKQPEDLKPVFDAAYDRDVTQPAKAFADIFPALDDGLKAVLDLADFLKQHQDAIKLNGQLIQVADASLQPPLQALLEAMRAKNAAVVKAQQRLAGLVGG
jgi:hypothetical protein